MASLLQQRLKRTVITMLANLAMLCMLDVSLACTIRFAFTVLVIYDISAGPFHYRSVFAADAPACLYASHAMSTDGMMYIELSMKFKVCQYSCHACLCTLLL